MSWCLIGEEVSEGIYGQGGSKAWLSGPEAGGAAALNVGGGVQDPEASAVSNEF